ncbi:MAG: hypothetical protein WBG65_01360, partial [Sulfurimonadaceae bacterium]
LELFIVKVGQPVAGHDMTVNVEITWVLKTTLSGEIKLKKSIITSVTKTTKDEGQAGNRIVVATEEATQENISKGIELISNLNLQQ